MTPRTISLVLLAGTSLSLGYPVAVQASTAENATPTLRETDTGGQLWKAFSCYACHGWEAQGGITGPRLVSPLLPFEQFEAVIRRPYGAMPAYSAKSLSADQLGTIYRYLESKQADTRRPK